MSAACCVVGIAPTGTSVTMLPLATRPSSSMIKYPTAGAIRTDDPFSPEIWSPPSSMH
jgi:hypothetical protein